MSAFRGGVMNKEISRIKELLAKATPGEWTAEASNTSVGHCHQIKPIHACIYVDNQTLPHEADNAPSVEARADAELICLLRNTIESLLDERERHVEALINIQTLMHGYTDRQAEIILENCKQALLFPESGKEEA